MYRFLSSRILLLLPACLLCLALQGQYYFDKLTEENGLSDNRVTCFLKDKTGFLWIGTKNGLNRYDGNSFKVFKPGTGNSISNEVINDIVQDASGKIWVATMSGLNIYDPVSNRWETMMPSGTPKNGLPNYLIWDLSVDEKDHIWVVSDVWDLSVIEPVTRKFTYYDWHSVWKLKQFASAQLYKSIQKIERKNEKEWWLGTTIGLFSVDIQSGQFKFYGQGVNGSIKDLKYDKLHGYVFTVTENGQLFCFDEKNQRYDEIKTNYQPYPAIAWQKKENASDLLLLSHPDGLLEVNTVNLQAMVISHQTTLSSTLFPGGASTIYKDSIGMVWVGTSNGINYFNSNSKIADFIPLTIASDKEATDGMSAAFYDTIDNKYYITSLQSKELFVIDEHTGKIASIQSIDGRRLSACTNICIDKHNNIWLLTETNVYRYDRNKMKFTLFQTPNDNKPVIFHDMVEDKSGDYWLATFQDGVYHYKTKENKFYTYTIKDGLYSKSITALKVDPVDNAVWLGSFNYGLFRYDPANNRFTSNDQSSTTGDMEYQQMNLIRDLEIDASRKLWVSTYTAGLYFCRGCKTLKKAFDHISVKSGLTHSGYYSITSDKKNRLWLLSGKGLSVIDQNGNFLYEVSNQHPVINFANYAPGNSYPKRIHFNSKKNELLVPVAGGLMLYYPDENIPAAQFPVVLTDISVDGRSIIYDSLYRANETISIPYKFNSLSFRFAALNYAGKEDIRYEYKLHENDTKWRPLGNSPTVNFPDMGSGNYTFLVRAIDSKGNFSGNTASFSFHIMPPFWKTWWFLLLTAWSVGAIIYLIYKYQLNKKLEVERLRLRIARDLHDDIGSALTSISVLSKVALSKGGDQVEMSGYLSRIKDSTMNTMESMSDIVWAINPKNDKLESLVSRMKEFAADICEAQGIGLDLVLPDDLEKLSLDLPKRKNLFLIFKEAVNNAAKYSGCTFLSIKFNRSGNKLRMIIRDNGNGFDQSAIIPGNGLYNMNERAVECGGSLQVESLLQQGTSITLEIPFTRFGVSVNR